MKKTLSLIIFLTNLILSTSLYADGIGAYFSGGGGTIDWTKSSINLSKNYFIGGGFLYDSNLGQDKLFNYRLNIGYDSFIANIANIYTLKPETIDIKFNRISLINTFGFGLIRTEHFRFWLGPQLGLKYIYGGYSILIPSSNAEIPFRLKEYYQFGEINGGLAIGLNFNINDYITITTDFGFRYGYILDIDSFKHINHGGSIIQHHNFEGFGNIGVLYRFNESHAEENKK